MMDKNPKGTKPAGGADPGPSKGRKVRPPTAGTHGKGSTLKGSPGRKQPLSGPNYNGYAPN